VKESTRRLWLGKYRGRKAAAYIAIFVLLGLLIGFGFPALVDAAWSTQTSPSTSATQTQDRQVAKGLPPPRHIKNFKAGKYSRSHGLPVRKLFKRPAVAKEVWVNKITRRIKSSCSGKVDASAVPTCRAASARMCDRCVAYELYEEMVANATCSGKGNLYSRRYLCAAKYPGEGPRLTKRQVQIGGAAVLCGGNVAIAARGGGGLLAGLFGGAACGWALWEAIDPG
jgi:hypothetical protein